MTRLSFPKEQVRILLLEGIHENAVADLAAGGYTGITVLPSALDAAYPNVILTPHIGGSTAEAQARIGNEVARKLADYSDIGSTFGAVNFPQVQLPARPSGTRFMHVHRNTPGMLFHVIEVFSRRGLNIGAQYLQTDGDIGYVVVDVDGGAEDAQEIRSELRTIESTLRARFLYDRR